MPSNEEPIKILAPQGFRQKLSRRTLFQMGGAAAGVAILAACGDDKVASNASTGGGTTANQARLFISLKPRQERRVSADQVIWPMIKPSNIACIAASRPSVNCTAGLCPVLFMSVSFRAMPTMSLSFSRNRTFA